MEVNPYAPPATRVEDAPQDNDSLEDASRWRRFCNYLIDVVCYYVLVFVLGTLAILAGFGDWLMGLDGFQDLVFRITVLTLYYWVFEATTGRTIGKLVTGTKVIREDGSALGVALALYRSLARLIPFEPFSILGTERRAWHDTLPGARVVLIRR